MDEVIPQCRSDVSAARDVITNQNEGEASVKCVFVSRWPTCWWPCAKLHFTLLARASSSSRTLPSLTRLTPKLWPSVRRYLPVQSPAAKYVLQGFAFFHFEILCATGTKLRETAAGAGQHPVNQKHGTGNLLHYLFTDKWLFGQLESLSNCCGWLILFYFSFRALSLRSRRRWTRKILWLTLY